MRWKGLELKRSFPGSFGQCGPRGDHPSSIKPSTKPQNPSAPLQCKVIRYTQLARNAQILKLEKDLCAFARISQNVSGPSTMINIIIINFPTHIFFVFEKKTFFDHFSKHFVFTPLQIWRSGSGICPILREDQT